MMTHLRTQGTPQTPVSPALLLALKTFSPKWLAAPRGGFSLPPSGYYGTGGTGQETCGPVKHCRQENTCGGSLYKSSYG